MHYHLIGIGGTAMASLAGMLQARGAVVTGSDENVYPPMSTMLESLGITVRQGYRAATRKLKRRSIGSCCITRRPKWSKSSSFAAGVRSSSRERTARQLLPVL